MQIHDNGKKLIGIWSLGFKVLGFSSLGFRV
jgi:hypothetical protein